MKGKLIALAFLVALASAGLCQQGLTVIQPNGGEAWPLHAKRTIRWSAPGASGTVRIILFRGGTKLGNIATGVPAGSGAYSWNDVGQMVEGMATEGGDCKIRIRVDGTEDSDYSDGPFTIGPPQLPPPPPPPRARLEVLAPNGGENFLLHHDAIVSWKRVGPTPVGKVRLQLIRHNCCTVGILAEELPDTGTFTWKAGEYPGNTAPTGQYLVRVSSMSDPGIFDESDGPFTLKTRIQIVDRAKVKVVLGKTESVSGSYKNWPGFISFPKSNYLPREATEGFSWNNFRPAACSGGSAISTAQVGIIWYPYMNMQIGAVYRSRIHFPLSKYAGRSADLLSAMLRMTRIGALHQDQNSGCGCSESMRVLKAEWNSFAIPPIGQLVSVDMGAAEFTRDVTEIVRQWLDGTMPNHGLLLLAGELPCSGGRQCFSCYEATLELKMK